MTPPTRSPISEDERTRRNDRRIALYSVVTSAVVAVVSILGGVWTTHQANQGAANQGRADFLRQQRQAIYGTILVDWEAIRKAWVAYTGLFTMLQSECQYIVPERGTSWDDYVKSTIVYDHDFTTLEIVGSAPAVQDATDMEQALESNVTHVYDALSSFKGKNLAPGYCFNRILAIKTDGSGKGAAARQKFIDQAKKDIAGS